ncbi:hypothetical protein Y1Q_0007415 [Alligator mississippiensis]|uniref:Uncharacterized protein n=1 Tax=Alligator mississippiensis TaxID=8496 RepID=A0A151P8R1_ALLMI|nr:hypothetical protein Y1Q_0007415 [Alligator mississippiensis]
MRTHFHKASPLLKPLLWRKPSLRLPAAEGGPCSKVYGEEESQGSKKRPVSKEGPSTGRSTRKTQQPPPGTMLNNGCRNMETSVVITGSQ